MVAHRDMASAQEHTRPETTTGPKSAEDNRGGE